MNNNPPKDPNTAPQSSFAEKKDTDSLVLVAVTTQLTNSETEWPGSFPLSFFGITLILVSKMISTPISLNRSGEDPQVLSRRWKLIIDKKGSPPYLVIPFHLVSLVAYLPQDIVLGA